MMHGVQNVQNLRKKSYSTLQNYKFVQTPIHVTLWTFTSTSFYLTVHLNSMTHTSRSSDQLFFLGGQFPLVSSHELNSPTTSL